MNDSGESPANNRSNEFHAIVENACSRFNVPTFNVSIEDSIRINDSSSPLLSIALVRMHLLGHNVSRDRRMKLFSNKTSVKLVALFIRD